MRRRRDELNTRRSNRIRCTSVMADNPTKRRQAIGLEQGPPERCRPKQGQPERCQPELRQLLRCLPELGRPDRCRPEQCPPDQCPPEQLSLIHISEPTR